MKASLAITIGLTIALLPCLAADTNSLVENVSVDPSTKGEPKGITVTTNDVVLIQTPSGASALVQFTRIGEDGQPTQYRWRYRPRGSDVFQSGTGAVAEVYHHVKQPAGWYMAYPTNGCDVIVRAGDIWIEWSWGSQKKSYLYYMPKRANVKRLRAEEFDRKP